MEDGINTKNSQVFHGRRAGQPIYKPTALLRRMPQSTMRAIQFWHHWAHSNTGLCVNSPYQTRTLCFISIRRFGRADATSQCLGSSVVACWKQHLSIPVLFPASLQQRSNTRSASMRYGRRIADTRNRRFLESAEAHWVFIWFSTRYENKSQATIS